MMVSFPSTPPTVQIKSAWLPHLVVAATSGWSGVLPATLKTVVSELLQTVVGPANPPDPSL